MPGFSIFWFLKLENGSPFVITPKLRTVFFGGDHDSTIGTNHFALDIPRRRIVMLSENGAKVDAGDKAAAEALIPKGRAVLQNLESTPTEVKEVLDQLQALSHKMSTVLYEASKKAGAGGGTANGAGGQTAGGGTKGGDDVIDADYKDVR